MKNIVLWFILNIVIGIGLYKITLIITRTSIVNIFGQFEIMLMLISFSSILSTIITCTKIILDKIKTSHI